MDGPIAGDQDDGDSHGGAGVRLDGETSTVTKIAQSRAMPRFPHPNVTLAHPQAGPAVVGDGPTTVTGYGGESPVRMRAAWELTEHG